MPNVKHKSSVSKSDPKKEKKKIKIIKTEKKQNMDPVSASKSNVLIPGTDTAFKALLSARFCASIWSFISDCDETFNYWEPLHFLIYGLGLQTWEYSPEFALRSYTYLLIHGVPAWIYKSIFNPSPMLIFYFVRLVCALACALVEVFFYKGICKEFGVHIGRLWLIFQLFSPGMFIASTALLPSSFSMYLGAAAMAAWWHQNYRLAIFFTAISTFIGWPFAVLIGIPIAYDIIIRQKLIKLFLIWSGISTATILIPMIMIDSSYFGRITIAPLNIITYNVFTSHGPNLYGVEPHSYYFVNGFLNFNLVWLLSLITPIMLILSYFLVPSKSKSTLYLPHYLSLSPLYIWLAVFTIQPHKEERFLFPIYPMISLCGAISVDIFQKLLFRIQNWRKTVKNGSHYLDSTTFIAAILMIITTLLGGSRIYSLYKNYHAPMDLLMELNQFSVNDKNVQYNVCIGKDWYRFPNSFFLPKSNYKIRFLKSEFKGILPAYYTEGENGTSITHSYFNDMNREDLTMYYNYTDCHYLLDLDTEVYTELEPDYAKRTKEWTIVKSLPFLNTEQSHRLLRAFYIPFLSEKYTKFNNFNLLRKNSNNNNNKKKMEL